MSLAFCLSFQSINQSNYLSLAPLLASHGRRDHIVVGRHGVGVHQLICCRLGGLGLQLGPLAAQLQRRVLGRHPKLMIGVLKPLQVAAHCCRLVVAAIQVEEADQQAQQHHRQDARYDGRHHRRRCCI